MSVILNSPLLITLYGAAFALHVFVRLKRIEGPAVFVSAFVVTAVSALALLFGASLTEAAAALSLFLIVMLLGRKGGTDEL